MTRCPDSSGCLPYTGYAQRPVGPPLLYYISDRRQFRGTAEEQIEQLLNKIAECATAQVDFIQLREKDLTTRMLESLAAKAVRLLPKESKTKFLVNSRTDVALASRAHGVHLPAGDLAASEVRALFGRIGNIHPVVAVSAHSLEEISYAEAHGADFAVFGPIFEKDGTVATNGLQRLEQACRNPDRAMPVLAIGGITFENAHQCIAAGANGIAAIRLFQETAVERTVPFLRAMLAR